MSLVAPFPNSHPSSPKDKPKIAVSYKWRDLARKTQPSKIKGNFYLPYSLGSGAPRAQLLA